MFSIEQKRNIANKIQQILHDVGHPELPTIGEINFTLHVEGRANWSWADIQNNAAAPIPSINLHNEVQAQKCMLTGNHNSHKLKSLAQYLDKYIEHEIELGNIRPAVSDLFAYNSWRELLEQALDAYESTENVTIKIERV